MNLRPRMWKQRGSGWQKFNVANKGVARTAHHADGGVRGALSVISSEAEKSLIQKVRSFDKLRMTIKTGGAIRRRVQAGANNGSVKSRSLQTAQDGECAIAYREGQICGRANVAPAQLVRPSTHR